MRVNVALLVCLALSLPAYASTPPPAPKYTISTISSEGGAATIISGINSQGWVAGTFLTGGISQPFYSDGSAVNILGGGLTGSATAINDSGVVGGTIGALSGAGAHPFLYDGGSLFDLTTLNANAVGSSVSKLTNGGKALLYGFYVATDTNGNFVGFALPNFIYDQGTLTPNPNSTGGVTFGLNDAGQFTGNATFGSYPNNVSHPVIFGTGGVNILPNFGALPSGPTQIAVGRDLNEAGMGTGTALGGSGPVAYFYDGAQMHDLGSLISDPGSVDYVGLGYFSLSDGLAINANGTVVGISHYDGGGAAEHGFVASGGTMWDLNDVVDNGDGWDLQYAYDINDFGQIVGFGTLNGEQRGFVLTPYSDAVAGQSAAHPLLPENSVGGDFIFNTVVEVVGQRLFFDPLVATGYDFSVTGSLFTSALFTSPLVDPDGYELYSADGLTFLGTVGIGEVFNFATPLSAFRLRGIAPQNLLDPTDSMAFVAGFTFSSTGAIEVTQTAISEDFTASVPEPASWALMIGGFAAVGGAVRRRARATALA